MQGRSRLIFATALCAASVVLSWYVGAGAVEIAASSEAELHARYEGLAVEDIFGFGIWFNLALIALAQAAVLVPAWRLAPVRVRQFAVPFTLFIALASAFAEFRAEQHMWRLLVSG